MVTHQGEKRERTIQNRFCMAKFLTAGILFTLLPTSLSAQPPESKSDPFVSQGLVSYDRDYKLDEARNFILFKIRNDGEKTISHLFGWVYRYNEGPEEATDFQLVNNPHQSAILVEGGPHQSDKVAQWRFSLNVIVPAQTDERFILRVSPKSVFYAHHEPVPAPTE